MKSQVRFAAYFFILILVGQALQPAVLLNINAEPPPVAPKNLKALVNSLNALTPVVNQTDEDGDGLWDPVERVIGTDFNGTDSDYDRLDDHWEVMNGSDPLNPDTNLDGFPDFFEVTNVTQDMDGDGVRNLFDPDNDGDGVVDSVDASPYAKSEVTDILHLDLTTNGNPTYVSLSLRPGDPEHLKLFYQAWDWPADSEPPMMDLDGSQEDLTIVPILRIDASALPDQGEVIGYGITINDGFAEVPLFPVWDKGTIVAFSGRMFYPSPAPLTVSMDVELIWRVIGNTDVLARTLVAHTGLNLTVAEGGRVFGNGSGAMLQEMFQWKEVGEDLVALRALNGLYLSVKADGSVFADAPDSGVNETFAVEPVAGGVALRACNDLYLSVQPDGNVVANAASATASETFGIIEQGYLPDPLVLAFYEEEFSLTGLVVEENYGSDVGLFYSEELNHTIAANLALAYDFLRNSSNGVGDMPGIIGGYGGDISSILGSYGHKDDAFRAFTNELTPAALDDLPDNESLPVVACFEDDYVSLELSELIPSGYIAGSSLSVDLSGEEVVTAKALQMNWYNTSSYAALDIDMIMGEVGEMGLGENATVNLRGLILAWNAGEQLASSMGDDPTAFDFPERDSIAFVVYEIIGEGIGSWEAMQQTNEIFTNTMNAYRNLKFLKSLKQAGWSVSVKGSRSWWKLFKSSYQQVSKVKSAVKVSKAAKVISRIGTAIEVVGILVEIGFTAYTLYAIFDCADWDPMSLNNALLKTVMEFAFTVVLVNIGLVPVIGWLIALVIGISDLFGGWSDAFFEWLIGMMSKVTSETTPDIQAIGEPEILFDDKDGNGLDVGDRITYKSQLQALVFGTDWDNVDKSKLWPYYEIIAPPGSNSVTGYLYPASNPDHPQYGLWKFPLPPSGTWTGVKDDVSLWKYEGQIYENGVWIEPGVGMPNFPVTIQLETYYRLYYTWEHFAFFVFYAFWCEHQSSNEGVEVLGSFTLKFDVMPGTLDDFVEWRGITPLDNDGDLLLDSEEDPNCRWKWDTDGDGLNDKFEQEISSNPKNFDTDLDGLMDNHEVTYGTNVTDHDTDDDGLFDVVEVSGWLISFNYNEQEFIWKVTSNPKVGDTDGDGVDDYIEYLSGTNPRSVDTNGDGVTDVANPRTEKTLLEYVDSVELFLGPKGEGGDYFRDIALDGDDNIYLLSHNTIFKLDSELNQLQNWTNTFGSIWAIDKKNSLIHIPVKLASNIECIKTYDLNFTQVGDAWGNKTAGNYYYYAMGLDVDGQGNLYVLRRGMYKQSWYNKARDEWNTGVYGKSRGIAWVDVYDQNRAEIFSWGEFGDSTYEWWWEGYPIDSWVIEWNYNASPTVFHNVNDMAVDDITGNVYISDKSEMLMLNKLNPWTGEITYYKEKLREDRVGVWTINGELIRSIFRYNNESLDVIFDDPRSLEVDENGYVYIFDYGNRYIHKFDQNGMPIASWNLTEVGGYFPYYNSRIPVVDTLDNIYTYYSYGDENYNGIGVVSKYSQNSLEIEDLDDPLLDRDGDGLSSAFETSSWDVTFTNATGTYTIHAHSDPYLNDTDYDGLTDYDEYTNTTDPRDVDTDDDSLGDLQEIILGTNPLHYDTDGDGLDDGTEVTYGSNPLTADTEDDGLSDLEEFELGSNPSSNDTDGDGLGDQQEQALNTSLFDPDTDGDFMFDGLEAENGTDPTNPDTDGDSLPDGHEFYYGTNPLSNDTDGDNVTDAAEIVMRMDPLVNDTDGDGSPDGLEIQLGTNPNNNDTDGDGIPDAEDPDSVNLSLLDIVVSYDTDNETSAFIDELSFYANLTIVDPSDLLANHTDTPYILLVGRPDSNGTVGGLVEDLLSDCGDVLADIIASDQNRMAVRHGVWNETQTVVLLSHPYPYDVFMVLEAMRSKTVTIGPDSAMLEYNISLGVVYPSGGSLNHTGISYEFFTVDEIDTLKHTDTRVYSVLEEPLNPTIVLTRLDGSTVPLALNETTGLESYDLAMGRYLDLSVSRNVQNETGEIVEYAKILFYYRTSDLDRDGDGEIDGLEDYNETTLGVYYHNGTEGAWVKLTPELDWVYDIGVNTSDVEIYGESYTGFVWVYLSHFSLFGLSGLPHNRAPNVTLAMPSVEVLWPANEKMVNVTVLGVTDPDGDNVTITVTGVTSDEPPALAKGSGGREHSPDATGLGTDTASLRAERSGKGNGRVYVVHFLASDGRGGETPGSVTVYVPHDVRKGEIVCVDDGQIYDATIFD